MKFEDFVEEIKKRECDFFCKQLQLENTEVFVEKVKKTNEIELTGLIIKPKNQTIVPTIYLESYYNDFCKKDLESLDDIVIMIATNYVDALESFKESNAINDILCKISDDYSFAKNKITMKLINTHYNKDLLHDVPYYEFGDLSVIFVVVIFDKEQTMTMTINNNIIDSWGVSKDEVYKQAILNRESLSKTCITKFRSIMEHQMKMDGVNIEDAKDFLNEFDLIYTLTNESRENGASAILDIETLSEFSKKTNSSFFILPNNIHECAIILDNGLTPAEDYDLKVEMNNIRLTSQDEFLSDNAYYFDKDTLKVSLARNKIPFELVG